MRVIIDAPTDGSSTTTLELAEIPAALDEDQSNLLHVYCGDCLRELYPARLLPHCGTNRPRNDDEITYPRFSDAPPEELCVVCLDYPGCPVCGAR